MLTSKSFGAISFNNSRLISFTIEMYIGGGFEIVTGSTLTSSFSSPMRSAKIVGVPSQFAASVYSTLRLDCSYFVLNGTPGIHLFLSLGKIDFFKGMSNNLNPLQFPKQ